MLQEKFIVRKVAVLGAGIMGSQIAAHLANAKVPTILFDISSKDGAKNAIVEKALNNLKKLKPAPLAHIASLDYITPANYDDDLQQLKDCDLVIEAVAEKIDIKESIYKKVSPHLGKNTVFATNTSGLSIEQLCSKFPHNLKNRFCGLHFFNPPRYMHLVELIPCKSTDLNYLDKLEEFLVSQIGKGIVRAKDTPNFIANRLGVFSMLATIYNAKKFDLRFDVVDDLTGKRLGRPKSATFRTADLVGLDVFSNVAKTMEVNLLDDPWYALFKQPKWLTTLLKLGNLGSKTKAGIFKKEGKRIFLFDPKSNEYIPANKKSDPEVTEILKIDNPKKRFLALRKSNNPQAKFIWAIFRDSFHYILYHAKSIANNARDIDFAIRWGFGWDLGPFEIMESIGIKNIISWLEEDIKNGESFVKVALPSWVKKINKFHNKQGSISFSHIKYIPRSNLSVYKRQLLPAKLLGENRKVLGKTIFENEVIRAFTLDDEILVFENNNKMRAISKLVLDGLNEVIDIAEKKYKAIIIWAQDAPFSVGADLKSMMPEFVEGNWKAIENIIKLFQDTSMRIRYSQIPILSAVQGFAFGGGCEFLLHCDKVICALESYIGLVEVGVGLIPAGGGTKEFALRASKLSLGDILASLKNKYMNIATARVATSGLEAKDLGYLREQDVVVFNSYEILYVAINEAKALISSGYRPNAPQKFKAAGMSVAATIKGQLVNMLVGGFISEYDMHIAEKIAWVITGGNVDEDSIIDEQWILDLERKVFIELLQNEKTLERIENMLSTGKPLRN